MKFMFDLFHHYADILLYNCMVHVILLLQGWLMIFVFLQIQSTPTRGTTVITAHQARAPRWPPQIQTTGKVKDASEDT